MSSESPAYSSQFFESHARGSLESARIALPLVMELVSPNSVADVGCGVGAWASACRELGVEDVHGYDGDYVPREQLLVPAERFHATDLAGAWSAGRPFDLAISLEVGEHLPELVADQFVESLCRLAPVVLFSAAIPLQGGTDHINEQWQSWWAARFASRGYRAIDTLRPRVWDDDRVEWWYRQNMLLYASDEAIRSNPRLGEARARTSDRMIDLVHPRLLERRNRRPLRQWSKLAVMKAWFKG